MTIGLSKCVWFCNQHGLISLSIQVKKSTFAFSRLRNGLSTDKDDRGSPLYTGHMAGRINDVLEQSALDSISSFHDSL